MMAAEQSSSLVLDGNPCQEETLDEARMAGSDFIVNVTMGRDRRVTGVFSGQLGHAVSPFACSATGKELAARRRRTRFGQVT